MIWWEFVKEIEVLVKSGIFWFIYTSFKENITVYSFKKLTSL